MHENKNVFTQWPEFMGVCLNNGKRLIKILFVQFSWNAEITRLIFKDKLVDMFVE